MAESVAPVNELVNPSPKIPSSVEPQVQGKSIRWMFLLAVVLLALAFYFDEDVIRWVRSNSTPGLRIVAELVSKLLDWPPVIAFLGGAYFAVRRWGPKDYRRWVGMALVGAALCGATGTLLRSIIGRARPSAAIEQGWYGPYHAGRWTIGRHDYAAFPSGHTSTVAGAAGVLIIARRRWGALALALTILVAWSRIFLLAHRLSDVVAAAILGLVGGAWIWRRWGGLGAPEP
jgi:membrane-associated phospholipid phosphatase